MFLESAETIDELTKSLAHHLRARGVTAEYADEMAHALTAEFATFEPQPPRFGTLSLLIGKYAIRKDDLKVFDALADGLKAAAGVSFFTTHQPALSANVAIGVSLARLLRTLAMRGVFLDPDTLHVLTILRCNAPGAKDQGLSLADIVTILQRTKPSADPTWVKQRLDSLAAVPTQDGAVAKLISEDASGRWRCHT